MSIQYHLVSKLLYAVACWAMLASFASVQAEDREALDRKVQSVIDEVDKSSNNQLFLDFLGLLREKYLMEMLL